MPGCSFSDGLLRIGPRTGCGSPTRSSGRWCRRPPREGPAPQASATRQRRSLSLVNIDDLPTRRISRSRSTSIHPMKAVPRARWAQRSAPIIPQRAQTPAASLINLSRRTVQPPCSAGAGEHLGADAAAPGPAHGALGGGLRGVVDGHGYLGCPMIRLTRIGRGPGPQIMHGTPAPCPHQASGDGGDGRGKMRASTTSA